MVEHDPDRTNNFEFTDLVRAVADGIGESFAGLAFGNDGLGLVLAGAFVLLLGWRLRKGPSACRERACVVRRARVLVGRARTFPRQRNVRYVPLQARRLGIRPAGIAPDETSEGTGRRRRAGRSRCRTREPARRSCC